MPQAKSLLAEAKLGPAAIRGCQERLTEFLKRYLPLFYRKEQRRNATLVIRGLLSGLERKTCEPIARQSGVHRKPIQNFVGAGAWDDEAVMTELRHQVAEELGNEQAVLVVDGSGFPKRGTESCGVGHHWCGHTGQVENCQIGVFVCYAAPGGYALLDRRLFLPKDWAADRKRRAKCHVTRPVVYQEPWQMALTMLQTHCRGLPHGWLAGDDEFGRSVEFRAQLRRRGERYVLDVPCNTSIRDLEAPLPPGPRIGPGSVRALPFCRVDAWLARQPASRWQRLEVRAGEKGPVLVDAMTTRVQTCYKNRIKTGPQERLLVTRTVEPAPRIDYSLSNAPADVPLEELVRVRGERYRIEPLFEQAKGDAGLDQYEVRSWVGWHHHMTLSILALWFLTLEQRRGAGKKDPGPDGVTNPRDLHAPAAESTPHTRADRQRGYRRPAA
jgi:SRSO17 transposase